MKSPNDEETIQKVMDMSLIMILMTVVFYQLFFKSIQAIITLNKYMPQNEKNISNVLYASQKIKDEAEVEVYLRKKQKNLYAYLKIIIIKAKLKKLKVLSKIVLICILYIVFIIIILQVNLINY